jgi:hypothetical protein
LFLVNILPIQLLKSQNHFGPKSLLRDRSLFIVQGGIEEKLEPLNFLKAERGALKEYRETKESGGGGWGFEKIY